MEENRDLIIKKKLGSQRVPVFWYAQTQHLKLILLYHPPEYTIIHHNRNHIHQGGGLCMFLHNSIIHKRES